MSGFGNLVPSRVTPQTFREIIDNPTNYYLETNIRGWLSTVIPLFSTNVIRNSQLLNIDGIAGPDGWIDASIADTFVYDELGGPYSGGSYRFTNFTGGELSYTQTTLLVAGTTYTPSVVMRGSGQIRVEITDTFNVVSTAIFTLNSQWSQFVLPNYIATNQFVVLRITPVDTVADVEVGFFQLENNPENIATTPFDGSFTGYQFESPNVYRWNGPANLSTSTRTLDTITGGIVVNLLEEFSFCITEVEGFGIPEELEVISSPFALRQGSLVRCKTLSERQLTIGGQLLKCDFKSLLCARNSIGRTIFTKNQLRKFFWQPVIDCNPCPCVEFIACLTGGFQGAYDNLFSENIEIDLTMYDTNFYSCFWQSEELETRNVESFSALIAIDNDGNTQNPLGTGLNQPQIQGQNFYNYCVSPYDGNLYYTFLSTGFVRTLNCFDGVEHTLVATFTGGNNPDPNFDNELRLSCCGSLLYVGGHFGAANSGGIFVGNSGASIARINLVNNTVNNIGDIEEGGLNGLVTAFRCETASVVVAGIFDSAGGVATTNITRWDGTTFNTNNFPIGNAVNGGRINESIGWVENGQPRSLNVGSFQNNFNATFNDVDDTLPETISYFDGTSVVRTDFIFDISNVTVPIAEISSVVRFNNTIFVGGNFGHVANGHTTFWIGTAGNRHRGIAVLDLNQEQPANGIVGRLLPLNGDVDLNPPTGRGTDGPQPLAVHNGQNNVVEIVRDMAVVNGELHVVGSLQTFGLIDADGLVDPGRGIIDPQIEICAGFIWTPDPNNPRFGTARPLDLDLDGFDLLGLECRIVSVEAVPDNAPNHLNYSHIYEIAANQDNTMDLETGGNTEITFCIDDMTDLGFRIHIQGPGDLRSISVDRNIIFNVEDNPIRIENGETFIANFENIPATFTMSNNIVFENVPFTQAVISGPSTIINVRFTPSNVDNPNARLFYKNAYLSSEALMCGDCD